MKTLKLTLLSLAFALTAFAQTVVTTEGTGEAAIINKDEVKAFEEAKDKALRAAVEHAAGVRIDADTVVVNNQLVRDQIFSNTTGYVKKFDVVSKGSDGKGVFVVKVKADVITESLEKDLAAARDLVKRIGRPKVVIMIQESTIQADSKAVINSNTFSTVISDAFVADGYDVKDPAFAAGKVRIAPGIVLQQGEAKEIGDLSKADFMVYGTANFRQQSFTEVDKNDNTMKMAGGMFDKGTFLVSGEYDLSVFATKTGSQIAKISNSFSFKNPGQALAKSIVSYEHTAMELAKNRKDEINSGVRKAILEYFRNQLVNGVRLEVSVGGLDSFGAAKDFKKSIEAMKGIKEATQDGFANGKAAYRVTFVGTSQDFAEALESSTFKKKKLNIVSVTGNTLEVQVGK